MAMSHFQAKHSAVVHPKAERKISVLKSRTSIHSKMYPKVKVKEEREEADQYVYEKSSLQSLKAFEWLSLHHFSSSDESRGSVVRIPHSYVPKSPTHIFRAPKEEMNKKKETIVEEKPKNSRATSAPRPRAVLSSPVNDVKIGSKTQGKRELFTGLKNHELCQNRHTQCKVSQRSLFGHNKKSTEPQNDFRAKGRTTLQPDSSLKTGHRKRVTTTSAPEKS